MTKAAVSAVEPDEAPVEAPPRQTNPRRSGNWLIGIITRIRRIGLKQGGDDDSLLVMNRTDIAWYIYHDYHQLGILDAHEERTYYPTRRGTLNVRPATQEQQVEYLVLPLTHRLRRVLIYRQQVSAGIECYDLRAA